MASRGRATAGASSSEELQLWQTVRTQLKSLENARSASLAGYERLVRAQSESPTKSVEGIYNVVENCILDEQRAINNALEQIDVLTALRQASMDTSLDSRRRKRKADDIGDESLDAPALDTKSKMVAESRRTRIASNSLLKRSNSLSATDTEDRLLAQLPLQRGRKVAFCQPQRGEVLAGDDGEVWIMATVIGSINNDPHRYIVQDAEDEGTAGPTYNTTIKSIAPLPNSVDSLPPDDYRAGTRVLALYPDTSCFYNATIQGGGPAISKSTPRSKIQKRETELLHTPYQLMFDDDGADIKHVPAYLVVEHP
ncbi:uncharacterized protein MJAP1_001828 [Malassezia japonica]|uniref:SGF29 C-terminal domain-containing protein n=1 Tax=Malassezia japonica TaxID=223818 RepID=A0AAF0JAI7_9BASI|nr:uncharacterized protein MJAP1_001828 [Malassezia japonica]WFD38864.1 hypothetical protein MJAP1_001828 [Malassezia japonica]